MLSTIILFVDSALTTGGKFVAGAAAGAGAAYGIGTYGGEKLAVAATTTGMAAGAVTGAALVGGLSYKANAIKAQLAAAPAAQVTETAPAAVAA
jgi:hypothetical protein